METMETTPNDGNAPTTTLTDPAAFAALHPAMAGIRVAEPFQIDSEERACWLLRKLNNIETEKARIKAQAAQMIAQLDADRDGLNFRFGSQLEAFTRQELEKRGNRRKSLTLLQGTCQFRTIPARLTVSDEEAAIIAARSYQAIATNGGYDLLPVILDKSAFVKFAQAELDRTGEMLPGVATIEAKEAFSVTFKSDDKGA